MADYYPLLARALDGLTEPGREARGAVYDRARTALRSQLSSIDPPLREDEISREMDSLEDAIRRVDHGAGRTGEQLPAEETDGTASIAVPSRADRTPPIRRGGRRGRSLLTAALLVGVIAPIAVAAWLWRDQPAPAAAPPVAVAPTPAPVANDPKRPERMGGGAGGTPAPGGSPAAPPSSPPASPPSAAPGPVAGPGAPPADPAGQSGAPAGQPDVAVAQRAALFEENQADPQQPKVTAGRALWRLDTQSGGQGQPLETVVRSTVDLPEANLSLQMVMRRNRDPALPASHTMELTFTTARTGEGARVVRDVEPPRLRGDDASTGIRLAALSVPVKENLFLIGLSDLRSDIERNSEVLRNRNWFELPIRFGSGLRATLVFEKGVSGERVIADALKQWSQP